MMNNIDEYLNQISLMKQALLFYAKEDNYYSGVEFERSIMLMDSGAQARFALETLEKVEKVNKEIEADYLDILKEELADQPPPPQNIINLINEIKKVK